MELIVVVREVGSAKPDYSLNFDLPTIPEIGSYLSITRPEHNELYSEDLIVRKVWWRLKHPEKAAVSFGELKSGSLTEIFVECDQAIGPYSADAWRDRLEDHIGRGAEVERFDVARYSVRQDEMKSE